MWTYFAKAQRYGNGTRAVVAWISVSCCSLDRGIGNNVRKNASQKAARASVLEGMFANVGQVRNDVLAPLALRLATGALVRSSWGLPPPSGGGFLTAPADPCNIRVRAENETLDGGDRAVEGRGTQAW